MEGKWIWKHRDFEFYHAMRYLLGREERGMIQPAYFAIPRPVRSVRIQTVVTLAEPETITVEHEGTLCMILDSRNMPAGDTLTIPAGRHQLILFIGQPGDGICAARVSGKTVASGPDWVAASYDGNAEYVGTSPLLDGFAGKPSEYRYPEEEAFPASDETAGDERMIDFGRESYLRLELTGLDPAAECRLFYGESREETYSDRCVIVDRLSGVERAALRPRACRYLRVVGDVGFSFRAFYPRYPAPLRAAFSGDAELTKIWDVSRYTMELCSRATFLDGIKRDAWPWGGDAYIAGRMSAYSYADPDILRRTIVVLRGEHEVRTPISNILEYSFYWFLLLRDYYTMTGDRAFIEREYEDARVLLDYYLTRRNERGLIPPILGVWLFIDWHDLDKRGDVCCVQMLFGEALRCMAGFADLLGRAEDAAFYRETYAGLRETVERLFWDEEQGAYLSVYRESEPSKQVRRHQNYLAILFGYADERKTRAILEHVWQNDAIPPITTPFFKFFETEVLFRTGHAAEALADIRRYYGGMLSHGATTFWEDYDERMQGLEHYAMYGDPFDKSLCHVWGAGPLYYFGRFLCGVRPDEPGFARFTVEPLVGYGDFTATVPTGTDGSVTLSLCGKVLSVTATRAGGVLALNGNEWPLAPGATVTVAV